ncbi:ankyrin repeat domain-containing protein [Gemmobacter caeruleus]|uniref:ankyrin repeat domain-containing protein n=1 Tax=Gemmobacter caeruleus TaxID=2595004 RepID=UPI0011EDA54E|nr:ankyrin repeat domain-containing protein [Gemmobacter caeruleus]
MSRKPKTRLSLQDILASCSDTLFPAECGKAPVTPQSRGADGDTPLHVMVWRGNTYAVQCLVEAGADVNAVGDMSETPLHVALRRKDLAAAELLLRAGAETDRVSEFGQSPRDLALVLGGAFRRLLTAR